MGSPIWQKSSYSGSSNACVEVRVVDGLVQLRESDDPGAVLGADPVAFASLLESIKAGGFDQPA
ncbi:DUF397 domain-containing protein [Kitasatospora purpeofusca]|uniref:DUF397 domain-containing protein n=1 Tax=Kitasatospora purpeofusca TaxID=67352 RepID=A0ABZ1U0P7_9ACTN|nr:DUF397 domain-containing protein [Kitasatospora purpeofusca]MCX4687710.1 DUF397 domain-containing protein [Kitasatospora purpeofusca]